MTFYEIAQLRYSNYQNSPVTEHRRKNDERREKARRGESIEKVADFNPDFFHPSDAQKVMVYYEPESGKAPEEVSLAWTQQHGEVDETNQVYPDKIKCVCFMKDGGEFCV